MRNVMTYLEAGDWAIFNPHGADENHIILTCSQVNVICLIELEPVAIVDPVAAKSVGVGNDAMMEEKVMVADREISRHTHESMASADRLSQAICNAGPCRRRAVAPTMRRNN